MKNLLYLSAAVCVAAALAGCGNKAGTVEPKSISDLELGDVRPPDAPKSIDADVSVGGPVIGPAPQVGPAPPVGPPAPGPTAREAPRQWPEIVQPPAPAGTPPMHYTVAKGDTLTAISRRFYGDATMVRSIVAANGAAIRNPNLIKVGQKIFLPAKGSVNVQPASHVAPLAAAGSTVSVRPSTYKVKKGDSLFLIAKRVYGRGSAWVKIYKANQDKIKNPDRVREGLVLRIPS
jgi:nucleoid-associated protein YgaU